MFGASTLYTTCWYDEIMLDCGCKTFRVRTPPGSNISSDGQKIADGDSNFEPFIHDDVCKALGVMSLTNVVVYEATS